MTLHSHAKKPKPGTWLVSCDVCGIIHLNTQIKKRWDNLYVCESDWERDHPQKNIKLPRERIAAPFERVESVDGTGNSFIPLCTVFSNQAVAGAAEAGCSVAGTWRLQDQGGSLLTPPSGPVGPPPPPPGAYRYWRLKNFTVPGSFLEISELRLTEAGVDVTTGTITSSTAPAAFSVTDLYDGNLSTRCYWTQAAAQSGGFTINWDFGAGNEKTITGFKQGGFDTSDRYIRNCTCQYSSDGAIWTTLGYADQLTYPGNNTLSANILFVVGNPQTYQHWRLLATANDGDANYTSMAEFALLINNVNIMSTSTSSGASSVNGGGETSAQAIDNNLSTEWVTTNGSATPSWIAYSFASGVTPEQFYMINQRVVTGRTPTTFKLQGNDVGRDPSDPWVDVASYSGITGWSVFEKRTFTI